MNETIRELNLQAMTLVLNGDDPDGDILKMYIPAEYTKKFAELIVQECVNVLHDNELWSRDVSHVLREHFGVEE